MPLWFAALFGLTQGLTEFIPVSSTAHLRILPALFGMKDYGPGYTAVIQLGTLVACLIYFAKDIGRLLMSLTKGLGTYEGRLPWLLVLGTVPIAVFGVVLKKHIGGEFRSLWVVASALIAVGAIMIVIEQQVGSAPDRRPLEAMTYRDVILIGLAQSLALVPGVSRSGATICAILLLGFARSDAARFSFLLSIPAVFGAGVFELKDAIKTLGPDAVPALGVGIVTAAISGYVAIAWLIKWLGSHDMTGFAVYRILAGIAIMVALVAGWLAPLSSNL